MTSVSENLGFSATYVSVPNLQNPSLTVQGTTLEFRFRVFVPAGRWMPCKLFARASFIP